MSLRQALICIAVAATAWASSGAHGHDGGGGDAGRGEALFAKSCAVCHSTMAGWNKEGPSLAGVFGRRAGTAPDFTHYRALRGSGVVWGAETLDAWLADPQAFSGRPTAMSFRLEDAQARADVIAYLRTLR